MVDILQNTLSGTMSGTTPATPTALTIPKTTGSNKGDIANLKVAQKDPEALLNLQGAMSSASQLAYRDRQASELESAGKQFDPTKVSGGTFSSILGNLERRRGADISKIYQSTMGTYQAVQKEVTSRLQYLEELEESRRRFEEEMKFKKKELKRLKKNDKRAYKLQKEKFEESKRQWQASFDRKGAGGSGGYSSGFITNLASGFADITVGPDGYINPGEFGQWSRDALSNAQTKQDLSALSTYLTQAKGLLNPDDRADSSDSGWK